MGEHVSLIKDVLCPEIHRITTIKFFKETYFMRLSHLTFKSNLSKFSFSATNPKTQEEIENVGYITFTLKKSISACSCSALICAFSILDVAKWKAQWEKTLEWVEFNARFRMLKTFVISQMFRKQSWRFLVIPPPLLLLNLHKKYVVESYVANKMALLLLRYDVNCTLSKV